MRIFCSREKRTNQTKLWQNHFPTLPSVCTNPAPQNHGGILVTNRIIRETTPLRCRQDAPDGFQPTPPQRTAFAAGPSRFSRRLRAGLRALHHRTGPTEGNSGSTQPYLPDLVMIISVPSSWNLSQSSLVSRLQEILAISSLGMMGVVGMRGSVHREEGLLLKSPWGSRLDKSLKGWAQEDFSTNCSAGFEEKKREKEKEGKKEKEFSQDNATTETNY